MSVQHLFQAHSADSNAYIGRKQHIPMEAYCVLCRTTVDIRRSGQQNAKTPGANAPDCKTHVMCFFETTGGSRNLHVHIFRADLRSANWKNSDPATESFLRHKNAVLCAEYPDCNSCLTDSSRTANFVHVSCFKIAQEIFGLFSARALYQIARLLRPVIPWPQIALNLGEDDRPLILPTIAVSEEQDLGRLIVAIRTQFPAEIQNMICDYLSRNHFLSVSRCSDTLGFIRSHVMQERGETMTVVPGLLPLGSPEPLKNIYATTVDIMGETCFKSIDGEGSESSTLHIPVTDANVQGIQVGLGTHGVVGLKILYQDGSSSPLLGRSPQKWIQTIYGNDMGLIRVWMDEFRLLYIDFAHSPSKQSRSVFWRQGKMPAKNTKCVLLDSPDARARIRNTLGSRAAEYLPFIQSDGKQIRSLTVFLQPNRIRCIQAGDNPAQRLGSPCPMQSDWPITFYIQAEENITSVHLLSGLAGGPFLLMTTSKGRTLYWGPHVLPFNPYTRITTLKHESTDARVDGLFTDPMAVTNDAQRSLGVILEPEGYFNDSMYSPENRQHQDPLQFTLPKVNKFNIGPSDPDRTRYITKTSLANVHTLKVQKVGDSCTGLWILRRDGTIDTLGRWDPSDHEAITQLYSVECAGLLGALTFVLSNDKKKIKRILVGDQRSSEPQFVWDRPTSEVVWWLGKDYNHVEYWEGVDEVATIQVSRSLPQLV